MIETLTLKRIPGLENVKRVFATTDYAAAITGKGTYLLFIVVDAS